MSSLSSSVSSSLLRFSIVGGGGGGGWVESVKGLSSSRIGQEKKDRMPSD